MKEELGDDNDGDDEGIIGLSGITNNPVSQAFSSFLSGSNVQVPSSLKNAMGSNNLVCLRYGQPFGLPESSANSSPFIGGPRRDPLINEEYINRSVRLDSSIAICYNPVLQSKTKSSRLSMGEAASLLALKLIPSTTTSKTTPSSSSKLLDVCLASLRGSERLSDMEWNSEFSRVIESSMDGSSSISSSSTSELFKNDYESIPNVERLADWLATKWAPAILRTYDIAGIRVGARPVYASRIDDEENNKMEIVWQELVNFEARIVGKLQVEVLQDGTGIVARRTAGNSNQGYGKVSLKPLVGEDVIIRSLADAAIQAVEKGLAVKVSVSIIFFIVEWKVI